MWPTAGRRRCAASPHRRAGRGARAARPLRLGQVDAAARRGRVPGAGRGHGPARRASACARARPPPDTAGLAVVFQNYALWPHLSASTPSPTPPGAAVPAGRRPAPRRWRSWSGCGSPTSPAAGPPSSPAGSSSASAWRGRWPAGLGLPVRRADRAPRHPRPRRLPRGTGRPPAGQRRGRRLRHARRRGGAGTGRPGRAAARRRVLQVGTPQQVYDEPADLFAARLTGPASVIEPVRTGAAGPARVGAPRRPAPGGWWPSGSGARTPTTSLDTPPARC